MQFSASRRWLFFPLGVAVVLVGLGVQLWSDPGASRLIAGLVVGVPAVGVVALLWRIARPFRLVVTPDVVRYRRLEVPWSDVVAVHDRTTGANRFLLLQCTEDSAARLGSHPGLTRRLLRHDDETRGRACVEIPGPFDHHEELVAWLEAVRARNAGGDVEAPVDDPENAEPPH
ncbi:MULTISPECIES: hypothetical protein [unclassified Isoptericola]|uniref:hypothetical protein n=1 Tax=unclassified Isoptericola TaxID=2623355 RepID=UPI00271384EB|nr:MULTISPECIES: hypothetical protein [unclassified Isoptericola]MDO8144526.1 hypothetical protein [Isoptericola sp. 178]MDO8148370.1 hypothetical protein [Isoptericola sp. b515]MDO8151852.1 hypothetical protein [Isoptericola sp. b408]